MHRVLKTALYVATVPAILFALAAGPTDEPAPPTTQPAAKQDAPAFKSQTFDDLDQFHRIVFVCDAGGSMINKMASLKDQLNKAFESLSPEEMFNVIFSRDRNPDALGKELLPASASNKKKAGDYLEGITSIGTTDTVPAIAEAFGEKPDVIYLLTDGDFPDNGAMLKKIRELNKDRKVKVYTIAFVSQSDTDTAFIDLLKTIAAESGGKFKKVDEEKL